MEAIEKEMGPTGSASYGFPSRRSCYIIRPLQKKLRHGRDRVVKLGYLIALGEGVSFDSATAVAPERPPLNFVVGGACPT